MYYFFVWLGGKIEPLQIIERYVYGVMLSVMDLAFNATDKVFFCQVAAD